MHPPGSILAASLVAWLAACPPQTAGGAGASAEAKPPELWFYCATNLLVEANVDRFAALCERAGRAGYSRVLLADSKFARLGTLDGRYFKNAARAQEAAKRSGIEIVPALFPIGYSESLLFHDPDLAEALPVIAAPFIVRGGAAEAIRERRLLGMPAWKDDLFVAEGAGAWRCRDPGGANARVVFTLAVVPHRVYHVALTVETKGFDGEPRVQALVPGAQRVGLLHSNLGVQPTQPPTEHHALFNSLDHDQVSLYVGAWGATRGELAVRDISVEEAGLVNLVRRAGAPFTVRRADVSPAARPLVEGRDFDPVADPKMGQVQWPGTYDVWHEPPTFKTRLPEGTRLAVSWSHAVTVHDGQVMVCPSEPRTLELLRDEATRVRDLFGSRAFFMSHDEIRVLNQDDSCRSRQLDAGALLADHVAACTRILREVAPGAEIHVWSDMFDPHHNARADYYLVRGDLAGSWEGLDRDVVIANWNFGERGPSLAFFAGRGHRQLIAGYYDAPVEQVREWLAAARKVEGVGAFMYTTWQARYDDLERFAALVRGEE